MSSSSNAFHHQIYTLASFRHMKDHVSPSPPPPASYEESKYLKLLDDIALLLIDSERGDVAAVSIIMTSSKVYLHYAKNGPCDPSLRIYLDEIQNILVYDDVKDMSQAMILKTMNFCIRKFKSRVVNCRMELNACGIDFGVESTAASEAEQGNSFSKSMPGLCEGLNNRQAIELFIKKIKTCDATIDGLQNNLKDSIGLTCMACGIGKKGYLTSYPRLLRRVQKLGSYCEAIERVHALMLQPQYFNLRHHVRFYEVKPPAQRVINIPKNPTVLLNQDARINEEEEIPLEGLASRFNDVSLTSEGNTTVRISCHCELTIALDAVKSPAVPASIEIGVSKGICWLCQHYMERLALHHHVRIQVSRYQGKCHAGWDIPPGTPEPVEQWMRQKINFEINDIREQISRRRKLDSFLDADRAELQPTDDMFMSDFLLWEPEQGGLSVGKEAEV